MRGMEKQRHEAPATCRAEAERGAVCSGLPDLRGTGARGSCVNPMPDDPRRSRGGGAGPGERPRTPPGLCPPACRSPPAAWPGSQQAMGRYRSVAEDRHPWSQVTQFFQQLSVIGGKREGTGVSYENTRTLTDMTKS